MSQESSVRRDVAREIRSMQREAKALWKTERVKAGHLRFTDTAALRSVGHAVERVYGRVQWRDVVAAIKEHAAEPYTRSPWYLDTWAEQAKAKREYEERASLPVEEQLRMLEATRR